MTHPVLFQKLNGSAFHTILRCFVLTQAFEHGLPEAAGSRFLHVFHCTTNGRNYPYCILIPGRRFKRRDSDSRQLPDFAEAFASYAECHMSFVFELPVRILSEYNACHTVFFRKKSANDIIIVFEIFAFDPVLCPFIKVIPTIFPLSDNSF